ncbi:MAG: hypothetical protein HUJ98_13270 [Bacteroidaceae bacterium]|nr:hypothetical protein [Bacteroidaceae bacterium]
MIKNLQPDQWRRSNKIVGLSMLGVYLVFIITIMFHPANTMSAPESVKLPLAAFYVVESLFGLIYTIRHIDTRKPMVLTATGFLIGYLVIVSFCSAAVLVLVFPILLVFTVYQSEKLLIAGTFSATVICIVKMVLLISHGILDTQMQITLITLMCLLICLFGGMQSVHKIILYSIEDEEMINEKAAAQAEVARQVAEIVDDLDESFHHLVDELTVINYSINNTNQVMDQIAEGSETTAASATRQAEMTTEIQGRLENTSEAANTAKSTTDDLRSIIADGKEQSDELSRQSELVDQSTSQISETVAHLVSNVSRVSDITNTILNISSQTNLLALNASIEAARAGEAGKGFAVVADEIRNLAEETKQSTEMITEIVNELISVTEATQKGLDTSVESINVQREKVAQVNASFDAIEEGIVKLYDGMNTVNEEVGAVLDANQTIVEGISTLSDISNNISSDTTSSKGEMEKLVSSMTMFSDVMEETFSKLQALKDTATNNL